MARVNTCPKCRALLDPRQRTCPYCQTDQRYSRAPSPEGDAAATSRMGAWILAVIVALFFLTVQLDPLRGDTEGFRPSHLSLVGFGASNAGQIQTCHQYWRMVTANFLHVDLMHLAFNAVAVLILIPLAAITLGLHRTLCIFFFAGVCGFWLSQSQGQNAAGASAGLCGLIAALAVYGKRRGAPGLTRRMMMWGGLILLIGFISSSAAGLPRIDNWGHGGGFLGGAVLGWPAAAVRARGGRADLRWKAAAFGWLGACVVVMAVWQVPSILRMRERREVQVHWADAQRTLSLMREVSLGRAPVERLPDEFEAGPGDSGEMARAIATALEETRKSPRSGGAVAAQLVALKAWNSWSARLACTHYLYFEPR